MEKKWCRITGIGNKNYFGHTPDNELVFIPKNAVDVEMEDIVEFTARPFLSPNPQRDIKRQQPFKWFAGSPRVIAKKVVLTACEWKTQQEQVSSGAQ